MKAKRTGKSAKKSTESKSPELSLATVLLGKHRKAEAEAEGDRTARTALVLETVLSGSDEQLQGVLKGWVQLESIDSMVQAWGPSNSKLLFSRLVQLLGTTDHSWAFPWLKAVLKLNLDLSVESMGQLQSSLANESSAALGDVLRLQGKLDIFDV